jgi:hypothetical protein
VVGVPTVQEWDSPPSRVSGNGFKASKKNPHTTVLKSDNQRK